MTVRHCDVAKICHQHTMIIGKLENNNVLIPTNCNRTETLSNKNKLFYYSLSPSLSLLLFHSGNEPLYPIVYHRIGRVDFSKLVLRFLTRLIKFLNFFDFLRLCLNKCDAKKYRSNTKR